MAPAHSSNWALLLWYQRISLLFLLFNYELLLLIVSQGFLLFLLLLLLFVCFLHWKNPKDIVSEITMDQMFLL